MNNWCDWLLSAVKLDLNNLIVDNPLGNLQLAVQHRDVGVWTYEYHSRPYAGFLAPSHIRDAPQPLPFIYVAYDPQFGTITTGYQASGYATVFDSHCRVIVRHR